MMTGYHGFTSILPNDHGMNLAKGLQHSNVSGIPPLHGLAEILGPSPWEAALERLSVHIKPSTKAIKGILKAEPVHPAQKHCKIQPSHCTCRYTDECRDNYTKILHWQLLEVSGSVGLGEATVRLGIIKTCAAESLLILWTWGKKIESQSADRFNVWTSPRAIAVHAVPNIY